MIPAPSDAQQGDSGLARLWAMLVEAGGEWAYVGAAFGVSAAILLPLAFWYVRDYHRTRRAAERSEPGSHPVS